MKRMQRLQPEVDRQVSVELYKGINSDLDKGSKTGSELGSKTFASILKDKPCSTIDMIAKQVH